MTLPLTNGLRHALALLTADQALCADGGGGMANGPAVQVAIAAKSAALREVDYLELVESLLVVAQLAVRRAALASDRTPEQVLQDLALQVARHSD